MIDISKKRLYKKKLNQNIPMPELLFCENDFDIFQILPSRPNFVGTNDVQGEIFYIKNEADLDGNFSDKIIIIEKADPGYDWIFSHNIIGLVTLYGGANSHMAIRCAEQNISAAIGIGQKKFKEVCLKRILKISPTNSILEVIS